MKKFIFFMLVLISACTSNSPNANLQNELNFSNELDFDQFILKLETYSKNNLYPNIDN